MGNAGLGGQTFGVTTHAVDRRFFVESGCARDCRVAVGSLSSSTRLVARRDVQTQGRHQLLTPAGIFKQFTLPAAGDGSAPAVDSVDAWESLAFAAATISIRFSGSIGLVKKSSNPASMQRQWSSGCPRPVKQTSLAKLGTWPVRRCRATSQPLISGISRSIKARCGTKSAALSIPWAPLYATAVSHPIVVRRSESACAPSTLSSTTRTRSSKEGGATLESLVVITDAQRAK